MSTKESLSVESIFNSKDEKLKEELRETIERTIDFLGNTRGACEDVFADRKIPFDENMYEEISFEVVSTYGNKP